MTAAVMTNRVEFGFVPSVTVTSLRDLGNWKSRADAIEHLRRLVDDLADVTSVLPSLTDFAGFLKNLLEDPNFKISLTTLQIWDALLEKVGVGAKPIVRMIARTLVKKLGDNKHVVREANMQSIGKLYATLPKETIDALLGAFEDPKTVKGPATARFKEDALCAVLKSMLDSENFPTKSVDPAELVSRLVAAAQSGGESADRDAATDLTRTRATAVEALALACDRYGKDEAWRLVDCAEDFSGGTECSANLRYELTQRFIDPRLPTTNVSDGLIQHCAGASQILQQVRPEDALGRQLEILPVSQASSRAASRGSALSSTGLGATTKTSGFHASLLKMIGRSPRAPSTTMPASTPSIDSSEDTSSEAENDYSVRKRQPRSGTATSLSRAAAAAKAKMGVKVSETSSRIDPSSKQSTSGDTWVSLSDEDSESPDSKEKSRLGLRAGGSGGSFGSQPRRATSPTITGRRPVGAPPGSPANADAGTKLNALKQRRAGSREGSLRVREGTLMRSTSGESMMTKNTFAPGGVGTPDTFARRQMSNSLNASPASGTTPTRSPMMRPARHGSQPLPGKSAQRRLPGASGSGGSGDATRALNSEGSGSLRNSLVDKNVKPLDDPSTDELLPCTDPERTVRVALGKLTKASTAKPMDLDWQEQYESLLEMRRLTKFHASVITPELHQIVLAVVPAVDSLRSQIAKMATQLVREFITSLDPKSLELELDYLIPPLVKRAGENTWLGGEADDAIGDFAKTLSANKVLSALLPHANHKAPAVRLSVSWHVEFCCESADTKTFMGSPPAVLLGEKTFLALVPLLEEGSAETRTNAKRSLCHLRAALPATDFDRLLKKLDDNKSRVARSVVEKGLPPVPQRGSGAGWTPRKTPASSSRGASPAGSLRNSLQAGELLSQHNFGTRRDKGSEPSKTSDAGLDLKSEKVLETLRVMNSDLTATSWDVRLETVAKLEAFAVLAASGNSFESEQAVVALFDSLVPRLADGNAKVQTRTLECVSNLVSRLGQQVTYALSSLVPGLGGGLSSSNEKTKAAAGDAVDALLASVSPHLLIQHVSHVVSYGAARSVPAMLDTLSVLVRVSFDQKPTLVSKYALPAAMSTLMNGKGAETITAVAALLKELSKKIGREALLSHAAMRSAAAKAKLEEALQ